jgi:Raf kinase inhibitor-like YbhB/YbcL family protein
MKKTHVVLSLCLSFSALLLAQNTFTLSSTSTGGQGTIKEAFNGFGCTGENTSPQLSWSNAPKDTKSFAVTMYDPDAPTGSGWWHWLVFDIPSTVNELAANAGNLNLNLGPKGAIQSTTNYGTQGYGGPCPPKDHGLHQYIITVHALKTKTLGLDKNANPATVGYYLWNNTLAKASIVMYYQRTSK